MRIAALLVVSLLVAGCSHGGGGQGQQTSSSTQTSASAGAGPTGSKPPAPSTPPAVGASMSDVSAWIAAGHPADPGRYHTATRDGVVTPLGDDIALTAMSGKVSCMTDAKHTGSTMACLVNLTTPPPAPATAYGEWKGGWVSFDGVNLQIGAARGDPGPFLNGNGPELANGDALSFNDYRCRADQTGLYCLNYAHQSAARFSAAGIDQFGCLRSVPPPDGIGMAFSC